MESLGQIAARLLQKIEQQQAKVGKRKILMAQTRCAYRGAGRKSPLNRLPCPQNDNGQRQYEVVG